MVKIKAGVGTNDESQETGESSKCIHPVYGVRTDIPPEVVYLRAPSGGQVSLAWTPAEGGAPKAGAHWEKSQQAGFTIPHQGERAATAP